MESERTSTDGSVYWIRPLSSRVESPQGSRANSNAGGDGSYVAIQKLITPHPSLPDSEIETILEAYVTANGECLWRRVSVWSGPNSPQRVIHSSFMLPTSSNENSTDSSFFLRYNKDGSLADKNNSTTPLFDRPSLVCWAAFPEKPDHKLLCVLAGPSTISIWDVYPEGEESGGENSEQMICVKGEGHTVPLPFRCTSIHPFGEGQGLLLQRQDDPEDLASLQQDGGIDKSYATTREDDNSGFIVNISNTPNAGGGRPAPTPRTAYTAATAAEIPSLFTMQHWLEEIVPVALGSSSSESSSIVTDVFEKVLHTTTLRWRDLGDGKDYEQPILVTYNTNRKRHAIWTVKASQSSSSMEPLLWRRSRERTTTSKWDNLVGVVEQDLEDMQLLGVMDPQGPTSTRDEALADALGLRRTPRMAGEAALGRGRPIEPRPSRNRNETVLAANNSGFLQNTSRSVKESSFFENDVSFGDPLRPNSNLRPAVALDCLFEELEESMPAFNVFLASNLEGTGLLVLGLVRSLSGDTKNQNSLHLYSILPSLDKALPQHQEEGNRGAVPSHCFTVKVLPASPCWDAQPVQTTRKTLSFLPQTTEILVLKRTNNNNCCMDVFRAEHHIMECALLDTKEKGDQRMSFITGISNPVRGSVDFIAQKECQDATIIRGCISLQIQSNALAEKALAAIESSMFNKFIMESNGLAIHFALKFRSDCCRLEQAFRRDEVSQKSPKTSWSIVAALLHALFDFEYFGTVPGSRSESVVAESPPKSPWDLLLSSSYHSRFAGGDLGAHFPKYLTETTSSGSEDSVSEALDCLPASFKLGALQCLQTGTSVVAEIFDALNFLYEDQKLSSDPRRMDELRSIGAFLVAACFKLNRGDNASLMQAFLAHYQQDLGRTWVEKHGNQYAKKYISAQTVDAPPKTTHLDSPPCILTWLDAKIRKETDTNSVYEKLTLSAINSACVKTRLLLKIFNIMLESDDQRVVSALREEGFLTAEQVRDELPTGAAIPILEVLKRFGDTLGQANISGWGADEYNLIRRNDLGHHHGLTPLAVENHTSTAKIPLIEDTDKDGILPLQVSSALLFPADNRIKEAGRLLRSSRPCPLSVPRGIEVSDHEYERLKQIQLLLLCRRALALPVGRGMLTFGSFETAAAEPLPVPELCLAGRVAPTNANLALDVSDCQNGFLNWPEFHNGVAAGLRLPPASGTGASGPKITRSWIVYNRPPPNAEVQPQNQTNGQRPPSRSKIHMHGGLLLALGLRGHLSALEMTDIYDYLTQGQVTLTCGVLLGMAANKRGSCDISVSKMLCLHLPSLMPQQFSAIDVASAVQTAAVTGTGMLFQGSSHRLMTEFLLNEIGRRPDSDVMLDREAYTLSCGIALGMINICKGDCIGGNGQAGEGEGIADLRLGERLCRYVSSGVDENETRRAKETHDRLNFPGALSSGEQERCCCIYEGDAINVDVTAAGSTLALGLVYMRTGNRQVSAVINLPDTHTLLEYVRPDFLALRVVSKALILWDDVTPSAKWIEKQLPTVVREAYKQMQLKVKNLGNVLDEDDEMNGTGDRSDDFHHANAIEDYDCQVVRQIYVHVIAGACFGLGLRFAGTADKRAAGAIRERLLELQNLRDLNDTVSQALTPEPQILETCLGCCAISLAMVNAGTGDLETLRLLKMLRWRCDEQVKFGSHMAIGISTGLLFLGGGTCTLGREPQDIAALVAAFFPRFPFSSTDNQYHLQAIRHLYALAVKKRDIRFADSNSGKIVEVPIEIYYGDRGTEPLRRTAPCLVPNGEGASVEIRVVSENYYPLKFELNDDVYGRILFVKRRTVCSLPKSELGLQHSLQVQQNIFAGAEKLKEYLQGNPYVLALVTYLFVFSTKTTHQGVSMEGFLRGVLPECLCNLAEMTFPIYLRLMASPSLLEANPGASSLIAWDLKLICSHYESFHPQMKASPPMLNAERLAYLQEIVERVIKKPQM